MKQSSSFRNTPSPTGQTQPPPKSIDPELYARLQREAKAPYRTLRRFIYFASAASGLIGAFIFLTQLLSGQVTQSILGNLAIQLGVIALMVFLLRVDQNKPET